MKVELNLATRPFGRSRLFWTLSAAAFLSLFAVAAWLVTEYSGSSQLPESMIIAEQQLRTELAQLNSEEARMLGTLRTPDTTQVYVRSYFLNQLLTRKGISWTKTFADLETVLPPRVQVMQIRPEVTFDNEVQLEMQVGAEQAMDFIEFLQAIEGSDFFDGYELRTYVPPNEDNPYYRYELTVRYEQEL